MADRTITLSASQEQQQALFGHAATDVEVYREIKRTMSVVSNFSWLNPYLTKLWKALDTFHKDFSRQPSVDELKVTPEVLHDEPAMVTRMKLEVDRSLAARLTFGLEPLLSDLRNWQTAVMIDIGVQEMARHYNAGDLPQSVVRVKKLVVDLGNVSREDGGFTSSGDRVKLERAQRLANGNKYLSYGNTFLDEITGGIAPTDLVVIGAKTGTGKTQTITNLAESNARNGKRVSLLALEAAPNEIERRLKYSRLIGELQAAGQDVSRIDYVDWLASKHDELFEPFEEVVNEAMASELATLETLYRIRGDFDTTKMEEEITRIARDSDLIIVDHLHYLDVGDAKNENSEYKKAVKKLQELSSTFGIPIVVVAHLRKTAGGRNHPLVPSEEEIHGSSDIVKMATVVITFGRVGDLTFGGPDHCPGYPTIMRVSKFRNGGSRTRYSGILFFDPALGGYAPPYALGTLTSQDTQWRSAYGERPYWATNARVNVSEVE